MSRSKRPASRKDSKSATTSSSAAATAAAVSAYRESVLRAVLGAARSLGEAQRGAFGRRRLINFLAGNQLPPRRGDGTPPLAGHAVLEGCRIDWIAAVVDRLVERGWLTLVPGRLPLLAVNAQPEPVGQHRPDHRIHLRGRRPRRHRSGDVEAVGIHPVGAPDDLPGHRKFVAISALNQKAQRDIRRTPSIAFAGAGDDADWNAAWCAGLHRYDLERTPASRALGRRVSAARQRERKAREGPHLVAAAPSRYAHSLISRS